MTTPPDERPLKLGFAAPELAAWRAEVDRLLAGAGFDERLVSEACGGVRYQPLYTRADAVDLPDLDALPGRAPFLRGGRTAGDAGWEVAQELPLSHPEALAAALEHDLARGQEAACLLLDEAGRDGRDPTEARAGQLGAGGTAVFQAGDVALALRAVDPATVPIHVRPGSSALAAAALVVAGLEAAERDASAWHGSVGYDPLTALALRGRLPLSLDRAWDEVAILTAWARAAAPGLATLEVDAATWADAGADAGQELGYALALGAEALRALDRRGLGPAEAAPRIRLRLSVGPRLLLETAKLRAARLVWARLLEACGVEPDDRRVRIHAVSSRWSRTLFDPHVNALRASFEALAAVLGGCDSLHVAPWDSELGPPTEPARRLARNTQLVLREESHLHRVADPLGGAWAIETLTRQIAEAAWSRLHRVEAEGGMTAALEAGTPQGQVADTARAREQRLADGRDALVGTTRYADPAEGAPVLQREDPARVRDAAVARLAESGPPGPERMAALDAVAAAPAARRFEALLAAARGGATLGELAKALRSGDEDPPRVAALRRRGAAGVFEDLRRDLLAWSRRRSRGPAVLLACLGPVREHAASRDLARSLFAVSGLVVGEVRDDEAESLARAAAKASAPAVVLVAGRERFADAVPAFAGALRAERADAWLALAGAPDGAAEREAWRAAGVDAFLHPGIDVPRELGELARRLGARP